MRELSWGQTVPLWYESGLNPASAADIVRTPQPDRRQFHLRSIMPLELPTWVGSMRLTGIRAFDKVWDVRVEDAVVQVVESE